MVINIKFFILFIKYFIFEQLLILIEREVEPFKQNVVVICFFFLVAGLQW